MTTEMPKPLLAIAYYKAYYELHDLDWKIDAPMRIDDVDESGLITAQFQIGHGPWTVPGDARVDLFKTKAGGASGELNTDSVKLENGTFLGIALQVPLEHFVSDDPEFEYFWKLNERSDDTAAAVGICLDQRFAAKPISRHIEGIDPNTGRPRGLFQMSAFGAAKSSVSKRSVDSLIRSIDRLSTGLVHAHTRLAMRWVEQSKRVTEGADRLVALWIAAEAIVGGAKDNKEVIRKLKQELSLKKYKLGLSVDEIPEALALKTISDTRNDIVHGRLRTHWWSAPHEGGNLDLPGLFHEIVCAVVRGKLMATQTMALRNYLRSTNEPY